jgi:hypothetical protein
MSGSRCISADARDVVPHKEGAGSQQPVVNRAYEVTPHPKEISNESMHRQESLCVRDGFEPPHLPFALAGRLMRDLGSIVFVLLGAVHDRRHHNAVGRRVAAQLVRDQTTRRARNVP